MIGNERAAASESRERSAPAKRRASERVGGSGGAKPPGVKMMATLTRIAPQLQISVDKAS
jgi:hypothetical protein